MDNLSPITSDHTLITDRLGDIAAHADFITKKRS